MTYNKIVLAGNLTRDMELKYLPSGSAVGKAGIAVNRRWKSKMGKTKEETVFIDLTFFGRTAEVANQYLRKGSKVLVDGRLILEQWTAQDGTKRTRHSITVENMQMLDNKADIPTQNSNYSNSSYQQNVQQQNSSYTQQQSNQSIQNIDIDNNEIPF